MRADKIFEIILRTLALVYAAIFFTQIILKLIGHSPTEFQVVMGSFGGLALLLIGFIYKFGKFKGKVEEFMENSKNSFKKIGVDIRKNTEDISELKLEMREVKTELRNIKSILKAKL